MICKYSLAIVIEQRSHRDLFIFSYIQIFIHHNHCNAFLLRNGYLACVLIGIAGFSYAVLDTLHIGYLLCAVGSTSLV